MKVSYLNSLLGRPSSDEYNILIAHNPDYFKAYAAWGADLVLSGHVHGGDHAASGARRSAVAFPAPVFQI